MPDALLLYAAPDSSPDMFHAIPAGIVDPFLYAEIDGRRAATVSVLDADKVEALGIEVIDIYALGADELLSSGMPRVEVDAELALRACRALGIDRGLVPADFPISIADRLRGGDVGVNVDAETFASRRRAKTPEQLAGIRRAQVAADAAMGVAAALIHELRRGLTSEDVREAMQETADRLGAELPDDVIVAHGGQAAVGHESGHGPIEAGEPVVVDIWPRDRASRCWADMTRTFVAGGGEPPEELARYWELTKESLERSRGMVRAGVEGQEVYRESCAPYQAAGIPTQLSKQPGEALREGYFHGLGHGVGLEVHERPMLGRSPDVLRAGDVITLEPGCYRRGYGGCRLEDLVLVTDDGCETLTDFPYDL